MAEIIEIKDVYAPELDVYARITEGQLLNRHEPEKGMFIAESPRVIERALDAGYRPVSFLVERRFLEEQAGELMRRCQADCGAGECGESYQCRCDYPLGCRTERGRSAADEGMQQSSLSPCDPGEYGNGLSDSLDNPALRKEDKLALILGTEGDGLAAATIAGCDHTVKIPMAHGVDSLNVAAASAVAFWQLCGPARQSYKDVRIW